MNLLARYNMLRLATLTMANVPNDDRDELIGMERLLRIPAKLDRDAAASHLVIQTLIATHGASQGTADEIPDAWVKRMQTLLRNAANADVSEEDARAFVHNVIFGELT